MKWRISRERVFPVLLAFLVLLLWCNSALSTKVRVGKSDSGKTIVVNVNDILSVELPGTPTTGYWWYFHPIDKQHLKLVGEHMRDMLDQHREGAPRLGVWEFKALKPGVTTVQAAYYRSWEDPSTAVDEFSISVRIMSDGGK